MEFYKKDNTDKSKIFVHENTNNNILKSGNKNNCKFLVQDNNNKDKETKIISIAKNQWVNESQYENNNKNDILEYEYYNKIQEIFWKIDKHKNNHNNKYCLYEYIQNKGKNKIK